MWLVKLTKQAEKEIEQAIMRGDITSEDIRVLKEWVNLVESLGPTALKDAPKWDDHPLRNEWKGHRSSCFSYTGRIIYNVKNEQIIVEVVRVTSDHNYKK